MARVVCLTRQHQEFNETAPFLPSDSCKTTGRTECLERSKVERRVGPESRRRKIKLFVTIWIFIFKVFVDQLGRTFKLKYLHESDIWALGE